MAKQDEMKKTEEREGEKGNKRTGERNLKHIIKSSKERNSKRQKIDQQLKDKHKKLSCNIF